MYNLQAMKNCNDQMTARSPQWKKYEKVTRKKCFVLRKKEQQPTTPPDENICNQNFLLENKKRARLYNYFIFALSHFQGSDS